MVEKMKEVESEEKLAVWSFCSYERNVSREFVNHVSQTAADCLEKYKGGELIINGYNPPWNSIPTVDGVEIMPGHFVLDFTRCSGDEFEHASLYLVFSCLNDDDKKFLRDGLNEEEMQWLREDDMSGVTVYAYNFDEAWQIACKIGELLAFKKISISCGGA